MARTSTRRQIWQLGPSLLVVIAMVAVAFDAPVFTRDAIILRQAGAGRGAPPVFPETRRMMERGSEVYGELCFSCHGDDGRGQPLAGGPAGAMMAPALAGSPRVNGHRDYVIAVLLNGLTGPLDGHSYSEVMVPMRTNTDEWIASVATYVRGSFGNAAGAVTPADVGRVRAATASRKSLWTEQEVLASVPRVLAVDPAWKATASHNAPDAPMALTSKPWTSGAPQAPGMWYQIELPRPVMLTEMQFESPHAPEASTTYGAPRGYRVDVSMDGTRWTSKPVAMGKSTAAVTTISFAPIRAKFLRITQTDVVDAAPSWSMQNVRLFEAAQASAK